MNRPKKPIDCSVLRHKQGSKVYDKMSFPVHCGIYSELKTDLYNFHFNLNNEIIRVQRRDKNWDHPHEWLKRTAGNDWTYYSTGGYTGVYEATGEYYLPNFRYPTNSILGGHPFTLEAVSDLAVGWHSILEGLRTDFSLFQTEDEHLHDIRMFLESATANTPQILQNKADKLHDIIGGGISVLPPDARHVDYNLIPVTISNGCLYKCRFCKVKNSSIFREYSREEIHTQIQQLANLYGEDLANYNSIFLGEHDALLCSSSLIIATIEESIRQLHLCSSNISGSNVFLFGSVTSLLQAQDSLFLELGQLPCNVYINIGLESADQETLDVLGKPITEDLVHEAFKRMQEINSLFPRIEITANFIMDEGLPKGHYPKILALIRDSLPRKKIKGTIYFSPLRFDQPSRARLFEFNRIKIVSRLPTYLYIIQRL
jgi:hypothetical protein